MDSCAAGQALEKIRDIGQLIIITESSQRSQTADIIRMMDIAGGVDGAPLEEDIRELDTTRVQTPYLRTGDGTEIKTAIKPMATHDRVRPQILAKGSLETSIILSVCRAEPIRDAAEPDTAI